MTKIIVGPWIHARASSGHKSGRSSVRETPVSFSIDKTNSAGTPRFDFSSQYQTCDCVVPMRSAKGFCPPANSQARLSGSLDMGEPYPDLGKTQPKNLWKTTYRSFGNPEPMQEVDPKAFGARVRARRKEFGWSQERLAAESGQSQSNITWIENGKAKEPKKQAIPLSEALLTTTDWLLYERGPRSTGPRLLTSAEYGALPLELRAEITALVAKKAPRKRA